MSLKVASLVLSLSTFISYFLGFLRDKTLAYYFGQNGLTDVYNFAFTIPDFIFNFCIAGALSGVFIPIFIGEKEQSNEKANELASIFMTVMGIALSIICVLTWIATPWLMEWLLHDKTHLETSIILTRIMLLSPLILGLSNTIGAIHIAHKHFFSYSISAIMYNLGIILGIFFLAPTMGIYSAGVGVIIGAILHAGIRIIDLAHVPFHYRWKFSLTHPAFQKIILSMIPRSLGLLAITSVTFYCGILGPTLAQGGFTAFTYARNFQSFPVNFFGITLATAILPIISELVHKKEMGALSVRMNTSLRQLLFLTIPAAVGLYFLSPALISILQGGAFSEKDAALASLLLLTLAFSIPAESLTHLYTRGFNAYQNTYFPAITNILFAGVAILIIFLTKDSLGILSFALGWMTGALAQITTLFIAFHFVYRMGTLFLKKLFISLGKTLLLSCVMGGGLYVLFLFLSPHVGSLILGILLGSSIFLLGSVLLKAEETEAFAPLLKRFFPKK